MIFKWILLNDFHLIILQDLLLPWISENIVKHFEQFFGFYRQESVSIFDPMRLESFLVLLLMPKKQKKNVFELMPKQTEKLSGSLKYKKKILSPQPKMIDFGRRLLSFLWG